MQYQYPRCNCLDVISQEAPEETCVGHRPDAAMSTFGLSSQNHLAKHP